MKLSTHLNKWHLLCATLLSVLAAPTLAMATPTQKEIYFSHKEWDLNCDNTYTCRAAGYVKDADYGDYEYAVSLLLVRQAINKNMTGYLTLIGLEDDYIPSQIELFLNDKSYGRLTYKDEEFILNNTQIQAITQHAKEHQDIRFVEKKSGQTKTWHLSDQGLAAVLAKMDDVQKTIHQPIPMPIIKAQKIKRSPIQTIERNSKQGKILLSLLEKSLKNTEYNDNCDLSVEGGFDHSENNTLKVISINSDHKLVTTPCWSAAYNQGYGIWVMNNQLTQVKQVVSTDINGDATYIGKDEQYFSNILSASQKSRGIGDCWGLEEWVWNGKKYEKYFVGNTGRCIGIAGGVWALPTFISHVENGDNVISGIKF